MVNSILSSLLSPTPACFHGLFGFGVFLLMRFCALFNPQIATRHYSLYSTPNTSVFLHNCTVKPPKNSNILVDLWCLKKSLKKILLKLGSSWKLFFFFFNGHKWRAFYTWEHRDLQSYTKKHYLWLWSFNSFLEEEEQSMWKKSFVGPQIFCNILSPLLSPEMFSQWINILVKAYISIFNIAVLNLLLWNSVSNHKIWVF